MTRSPDAEIARHCAAIEATYDRLWGNPGTARKSVKPGEYARLVADLEALTALAAPIAATSAIGAQAKAAATAKLARFGCAMGAVARLGESLAKDVIGNATLRQSMWPSNAAQEDGA